MINILYDKSNALSEFRAKELAFNMTKKGIISVIHAIKEQKEMDEFNNSDVAVYPIPQSPFKPPRGGKVIDSTVIVASALCVEFQKLYKGGPILIIGKDDVMPRLVPMIMNDTTGVHLISAKDPTLPEYVKYAKFVIVLDEVPDGTALEIQDDCIILDYCDSLPEGGNVYSRESTDRAIISYLIMCLPMDMANILDMKEGEEHVNQPNRSQQSM